MKLYLWCSGQLLYDWNSQPSADNNNAKSNVINILQLEVEKYKSRL